VSPRLPALTGKQLVDILRRHGFEPTRQSGSHVIMKHPDGRRTTVPVHSSRDLGRGLLGRIMRDADITADDLIG